MSIYDPINRMLVASQAPSVTRSFAELEDLIGRPLPKSAYEYDAWWANEHPDNTTHSHSRAWTRAGYNAKAQRLKRMVTFCRK
jgi:hypothetical protein